LDISLTKSYLDVAIPRRNPVMVRASLATEPRRLLQTLRSDGLGTLAVDVAVLDGDSAEWARGRMEWTIRQRRFAGWPVDSP
jgi:hypothetical protein